MAKIPDNTAMGGRPTPNPAAGSAAYNPNSGYERTPGDAAAAAGGARNAVADALSGAANVQMAQGQRAFQIAKDLQVDIQREADRANTLAAEDAFNKLLSKKHELTFSESDGFIYQRGEQAINRERPLMADYGQRFERAAADIEGGLQNDEQRQRFRQRANVARASFDEDVWRHVARESDTYAKEVYDATIATSIRDATAQWDSPNDVGLALVRVQQAVAERADRYGWKADYTKATLQMEQGKIHATVVKQALAADNYKFAEEYAKAHKGDIDPATAAAITREVEQGTQRQLAADYRATYLASENNPEALRTLQETVMKDPKLDDVRRNIQVGQIQSRLQVLENKAAIQQDRQLRSLERGITELNANTLAGFEPSPEQLAPYITAARGTELEPAVTQAVQLANATRNFRNQPPSVQEAMLSQAEAGIRSDPTKFDRRIVTAWRQIYDAQREQVKQSPVSFAVRQGLVDPPAPIDFERPERTADALGQRFSIARSVSNRYGSPMKPLTPEETNVMRQRLDSLGPEGKRAFFGGLAQAAGQDYEGYSAMMAQIAPDDPVTAMAGQYAFHNRPAADLMLAGQKLLRPQRKEDGTPDQGKLWPMPSDTDLRKNFQSYEKDAFAGKPGARNAMFQAAKAIYAKMSSDEGDATGVLKPSRWEEAIRLSTGGIEKYNGRAVVLPYGQSYDQFRDNLSQRVGALAEAKQLPEGMTPQKLLEMPLEAIGDGRYVFRAGNSVVGRPKDYGTRPDGTPKGAGFLGEVRRPDGAVSTELSIGVIIDGRSIEIPTMVPTLDKVELQTLLTMKDGEEMPRSIVAKAIDHAVKRMKAGKSPFAGADESPVPLEPLIVDFNQSLPWRPSGRAPDTQPTAAPTAAELEEARKPMTGRARKAKPQ